MTTKFTQGPWKRVSAPPVNYGCTVDGDPYFYNEITAGSMVVIAGDMASKDAALIAAAPDMYEALQAMLKQHGNCGSPAEQEATDKARAALAKADKGGSHA